MPTIMILDSITRMLSSKPSLLPSHSHSSSHTPINSNHPKHFSHLYLNTNTTTKSTTTKSFSQLPLIFFIHLLKLACFPYIIPLFPMAFSGFEGFEKRLELHFFGDDPTILQLGLRKLDFESIEQTLQAVQCTVVSAVGNSYFDAYVLSESSLFVYPTKIIIKTCGTTQLLKSILPLIYYASHHLGLTLSSCRYTRGSFIFPKAQPFPHTSFKDEVTYLENSIPTNLCYRKASIMPSRSSSHSWHVFTASHLPYHHNENEPFTMEICMTELDPILASKFSLPAGDEKYAGKEMTKLTGIDEINKDALICDFAFDPCGYSMNGMDGDWYSTIHVTPEDGYSYASFECVGSISMNHDIVHMLRKVVQIFRPGTMSVSTTTCSDEVWTKIASAVEPLGLKCRSCTMDEFPDAGTVVFQTFKALRRSS